MSHPLGSLRARLSRGSVVPHVLALVTGTAAAQLVLLLVMPVVARLYGPTALGELGLFMSLVWIAAPLAALAYPAAIVLPADTADARALALLSLRISILLALLLLLILTGVWLLLPSALTHLAVGHFVLLLPLVIVGSGLLQVLQQVLLRQRLFGLTARVVFLHAVVMSAAKLLLGWFWPQAGALIALAVVDLFLNAAMLAVIARGQLAGLPEARVGWPDLRRVALRYRDFPFFRAPHQMLNALSQGIPLMLLGSQVGVAAAGFYAVARSLLIMPTQLLGKSVGDVFLQRVAVRVREREAVADDLRRATASLALLGLLPFALVVAFGPQLFEWLLGGAWLQAGHYARWLALWLYCTLLNTPSVSAIAVLGLQSAHLAYEVFCVALRAGVLLLVFQVWRDDLLAVACLSLLGVVLNVILISAVLRAAVHHDRRPCDVSAGD